jgi:glutaconate CoA-transferase subunit B
MSRHLRNDEMGFIGVGTGGEAFIMAIGIPAVASRLAQLTHAPDYMVMFGPIIDALLDGKDVPATQYEYDLIHWPSRAQITVEEALTIFKRGKMGVGFVSSAQIDPYGNLNITSIGENPHHPKVRLPGSLAQTDHHAHAKRTIITVKHSKRAFVEKVDFISAVGHENRDGLQGGGPELVISDLAVMDFNPVTKKMRLKSVHPGVSVQEVKDHTGFALEIPDKVPVTKEPDDEMLELN